MVLKTKMNNIYRKFIKLLIYLLKFILLLLIIYIIIIFFYFFPFGSKIAEGVNQRSISLLKIGMDEGKVIQILGEPFSRKISEDNNGYRLNYTTLSFVGTDGTQVYLYIENRKLTTIVMKDFSDYGFFFCDERKCPVFINQKYYDEYIPK